MADANRSSGDTVRGGERGERAMAALGARFRRLGRWAVRFTGESLRAWRYLDFEQRVAGVGALLLIVSTFGPFSFVEAAIVLVGLAVLLLLKKRADGRSFHLPFGDGAVIMAAGAWSAVLIVIRLLDRPLGQNLLALVCASLLALAGLRMRLRRPADDLPQERERSGRDGEVFTRSGGADAGEVEIEFATGDTAETAALTRTEKETTALPPPPAPPRPARRRRRRTPAAQPPPASAPPTAVRPKAPAPPPPPPTASDPDFDLPEPDPARREVQPPPAAEDAAGAGPFRARPAPSSDSPPPRRGARRRS